MGECLLLVIVKEYINDQNFDSINNHLFIVLLQKFIWCEKEGRFVEMVWMYGMNGTYIYSVRPFFYPTNDTEDQPALTWPMTNKAMTCQC